MMRNISITGATGFIGRHLLENLARQPDVSVHALAYHTQDEALPRRDNIRWVRGDLENARTATDLFTQGGTAIHLAHPQQWSLQTHLACIAQLAQSAAACGVRRVIHCSTAVVVGAATEQRVTETTPALPRTGYEHTKLALEAAWREHAIGKFDLAIARPTAVFGPGGKNLLALVDALSRGSPIVNYLRSSLFGNRRMNLVCVQDVVAAIRFLVEREATSDGAAFLIADDDDSLNNFRDVERILQRELGTGNYWLAPVPLPSSVLKAVLRLTGRSNPNPGRMYDCTRLRAEGWRNTCSLEQGLREFAEWYKSGRSLT